MRVVKEIKDTAKKATNKIADTIEQIVEKSKSSKELSSKLVEHLSHHEYNKIAKIVNEKIKKYSAKLDSKDLKSVNDKLDQFESKMNDLATNSKKDNYQEIVAKLKAIEKTFSTQSEKKGAKAFSVIKSFLNSTIKVIEEHTEKAKKGLIKGGPNYNKLKSTFEKNFNKLIKE